MSRQLAFALDVEPRPERCRSVAPRAPLAAVPVHREARAAGRRDGLTGSAAHAHRWPSGTYGHADYMLGLDEGERAAGGIGCDDR